MSVVDGQNANASTFNSAFASKSSDNTLTGKQTLSRPGSGATVIDEQQAINDLIASDALKIPTAEKGVANGVATLDASTLIPVAQVPNLTASKITDFNTAADARITAQKGAASGIAPLDGSSKIDASYLPSYVDDVVEVANFAALPVTGETGKIYVTLDTNKTYRWSGSVYVNIGQPIASTDNVPEGSINQYFTPARVADKQIGIQFQDQGSNLGTTATVDTIDFIGAGITATRATNKVTVEVTATGGGGGSKNYFSQSSINPDFETGTVSPWQAMTTTWSGSAPVNAPTAGAVVTSFYTNIVNPLAGTTSATMTKGLGNGQYEGVMSGVFTIDREDLAKVLYGSFAYEVAGTVASDFDVSGTSTQSLEIWLYNVNANQWIQPAGFRGINQFTGSGKVTFSFQTDATVANNQYRICLIVRQNTTGAWNLKLDDFSVGPQAIVLGSAMTDWKNFTPTYAGGGSANYNTRYSSWRRNGDTMEIKLGVLITASGSGSSTWTIAIPNGLSIDTSKLNTTTAYVDIGSGDRYAASTASHYSTFARMLYTTPTTMMIVQNHAGSDAAFTGATVLINDQHYINVSLPILGWGSFSQVSSDTDTRVISFTGSQTSQAVTGLTTDITFTASNDKAGAWGTNSYTVPVSGDYVMVSSWVNSAANGYARYYKNGTFTGSFGSLQPSTGQVNSGMCLVPNCKAGDTLSFRDGTTGTITQGVVSIFRLSGPSVITATETVACRYSTAAGQSISSGSYTTVVYGTKSFDTHNFMNSSTGVATIPVSGKYLIGAFDVWASTTWATGQSSVLAVYVNGSSYGNIYYLTPQANAAIAFNAALNGSIEADLKAGDTVEIKIQQNKGGPINLATDASLNHIYITRVGN